MLIRKLYFLFTIAVIFSACGPSNRITTVETFQHPDWSYNLGIYEVNIRQFSPEGNFQAFIKKLPELYEMGVGIIWLMPIHPIGEKNRKGTLGSYYSVRDYKKINPEFGTEEDFAELVNRAHSLGMFVIIDWVANHSAWDNDWTVSHPDFYRKDKNGNFVPPLGTDWSDVIDFDYSNKELRKHMIDALKYWVEKFNIDGYRCDVAARVPTDFWVDARNELNEIKPVFMLAEAHEPELHKEAFDMTYFWQFKDFINDIAAKKRTASDLYSLFEKETKTYPKQAFRMIFTSNHDENSWHGTEVERLGNGFETFAVLSGVCPGMLLIYNGQEAASNKRLNFFEKDLIKWKNHQMKNIYKTLLELKKKNKALWNGEKGAALVPIKNNNKNIFSFARAIENHKIFCIFNLSDSPQTVDITAANFAGSYKNVFNDKEEFIDKDFSIKLNAWEYKVLTSY